MELDVSHKAVQLCDRLMQCPFQRFKKLLKSLKNVFFKNSDEILTNQCASAFAVLSAETDDNAMAGDAVCSICRNLQKCCCQGVN